MNKPVAVGIDVAAGKYSINLQISWVQNQTSTATVPGFNQPLAGGGTNALFPDAWQDTFDSRSAQGNIVLPPLKAITGVVVWGGGAPTDSPGCFHIVQASGLTYSLRPANISQTARSVVNFGLPLAGPEGQLLSFFMNLNASGFIVGAANLTLLTWDIPYFLGGD